VDVRQGFEMRFEVFLGARDAGGEGVAFVLHNDSRGSAALGAGSSAFGAVGIVNGLGIELDTRDNGAAAGDIAADHTNFLDTDNGARVGAAPVALPNLEDGAWHTLTLRWTPTTAGQTNGTLTYQIDGLTRGTLTTDLATTYLGGSALAHFGFTGATNSVSNLQEVRVVSLNATFDGTAAIRGGPGTDRLIGSAVVNTFDGGRGNDRFTGGGSTDLFVFTPGWGADSITDFADAGPTQDVIDLRALGLGVFANVPAPVQVGADTVLTFTGANAGNTITLVNFTAANLGADDFLI
jgi:Ca2+-binding RTX toxin-like protein